MDIKMHSLSRSEDEAMKMADEAPISSGYYRKLKLKESMLRSNQMLLDSKCS